MSTTGHDNVEYALGSTQAETERLIRQAVRQNRATREVFAEAGIAAGMRVLDIGSGAGDVALVAAEIVGPTGVVVGVDRNPTSLATARERARAAGHANVTFVEGEIGQVVLADDFDALVGRLVLMYFGDPAATLRRLLRHVRPGGVVAFQETAGLVSGVSSPPCALTAQLWSWMVQVQAHAGADTGMGFRLRRTFLDAGLPEPEMRLDARVSGGPDAPSYETQAATIRSLLPKIVEYGIATVEEVGVDTLAERLRREVVAGDATVIGLSTISAWARKP